MYILSTVRPQEGHQIQTEAWDRLEQAEESARTHVALQLKMHPGRSYSVLRPPAQHLGYTRVAEGDRVDLVIKVERV